MLKKSIAPLILIHGFLFSQSVHFPLNHWAYGFIERMETRGVLSDFKNGTKPFSRKRMADLVLQIEKSLKENSNALTGIEREYLERLKGELWDELNLSDISILPAEREPHLYSWKGDAGLFHLDALMGGSATLRTHDAAESDRRVYQPYYGFAVRGAFWNIGFYSDNRIYSEWGSGKYFQNYDASIGYPRNAEKDSSRATWDMSDSYFMFGLKGIQVEYGRDNVQWGPSLSGGLMFSGLAPSMDMIRLNFDIGPALFTWLHGQLRSDIQQKWISAHRIEFTPVHGVSVGIHDAVIYANRGLEPAYFNPVLPFLVAQHSLGNQDNLVMGLDASVNGIHNLKLYAEFLIDDFTSPWGILSNSWVNKQAVTAGAYWTGPPMPEGSGFRFEYTRIEPFVYTHDISSNVFEHFNVGLGSDLQPNSDRLRFQWDHWFSLFLRAGAEFVSTRHGQGDRRTPHTIEDGIVKHFLAGVLEKTNRIGIHAEYEPFRDMVFRCEAANVRTRNWQRMTGSNPSWNEWILKASWNW